MEKKYDPENYHKLSEPFESADKANEAFQAFHDDVSELRKKHKIADLLIVIKDSVRYEDGRIGQVMLQIGYGYELNQESMAAYAYGQAQADHREMINKIMAKKLK